MEQRNFVPEVSAEAFHAEADGTDRWRHRPMATHGKPFWESEYGATYGATWKAIMGTTI